MPLRFQRRKKILPGVWINFSKKGISSTFGVRGAKINVGKKGTYLTMGIPGTGISERIRLDTTLPDTNNSPNSPNSPHSQNSPKLPRPPIAPIILGIVSLALALFPAATVLAFVPALLAVILGVRGRARCKSAGLSSALATVGMMCGIISLGLIAVYTIIAIAHV